MNEIEENLHGKIQYLERRYQQAKRDCHWQTADRMAAELRDVMSQLDRVRGRSMDDLKFENVMITNSGSIRRRKGYTLIAKDSTDGIVAELRQRVDGFQL